MTHTPEPSKMAQRIDLRGQVFGRLTVIEPAPNIGRRTAWLCRCECGNTVHVKTEYLRSGTTKSCGCLGREHRARGNPKHGGRHSRAYSIWTSMRTRCNNPNDPSYEHYGGRGIKVCPRWDDFANFLADMGEPPEAMTLERIDVNGDYAPENCRWATRQQQARNTRANSFFEYQGERLCLADWAEKLRIPYNVLLKRIHSGKTFEEAIAMGWESPIEDERRTRAALEAVKFIPTEALDAGVVRELVEALEVLVGEIEWEIGEEKWGRDPDALPMARAVLAKVRGEGDD